MFAFFKDELEARKSLKAFINSQNYNKIFSGKFSFLFSKDFLKFSKLMSNLILGQVMVSNLTNEHKLNSRINYARLH